MSSILKALQKLEQEKANRVTREPDIHTGITRRSLSRAARPKWLVPASMVIVASVSILVTYLVMKNGSGTATTAVSTPPRATTITAIPASPETVGSSLPPPAAGSSSGPQKMISTPLPPPDAGLPIPRKQLPKPATPVASTEMPASEKNVSSSIQTVETSAPPKTDPPVAAQTPQAMPNITINGIAWQKDSSSSMAVINGVQVTEGSIVQGTKVEEIFPDRIRFSRNGKQFEVHFGKGEHQ